VFSIPKILRRYFLYDIKLITSVVSPEYVLFIRFAFFIIP